MTRPYVPPRASYRVPRAVALLLVASLALSTLGPVAPAFAAEGDAPISSGGDGEAPDGARAMAKWTYLLYMSADNNLEDEGILNVNQMEVVGSSEDINIVLQLDRSPQYDETNGNWSETRRYYVTRDTDPEIINSQLLEQMGEKDMGNGDVLRDFVIWGVENYPAERYYLDIWGHGGGWKDGTCNDYTSGSVIGNEELGKALAEARAATNVTLDGLGFDQCLMAMVEVFYQIKAMTDVLVGAETLIPSKGYNYTRIFEPLEADPGMTARLLGALIVSTFFDEYGYNNERAHSAVDAEQMDAALAPALNWLAQLMRGKADTLHDEFKWARDHAQTYRTIDYIDVGNFTERLLEILPENETAIRMAASWVSENISSAVIAEEHGTERNGSTGLSFYFPEYGSAWSYARQAISLEQRWDDFLDAYFSRKDHPNSPPNVSVDVPYPGSVVGLVVTLEGSASDADGEVTYVEWKVDRGDWHAVEAGEDWAINISTTGLESGIHRLSVRARDDGGDYSREVHVPINVESRGLRVEVTPDEQRTYQGGSVKAVVNVSAFGDMGGAFRLEVITAPLAWVVNLDVGGANLPPGGSTKGEMTVLVDAGTPKGIHHIVVRTYMHDAPLIQAFATLSVNVTDNLPDLVVTSITLDPPEPSDGDIVHVNFTITNTGLVNASQVDIELRTRKVENGNSTDIKVLGTFRVAYLGVGQELTFTARWYAWLGLHEFTVIIDPAGNLSDLNRADNRMSVMLRLEGYAVKLVRAPIEIRSEPGMVETFFLEMTNMGNLDDIIQLRVTENPLGWPVELNESAFFLTPREMAFGSLEVRVPASAVGGTYATFTVEATSLHDENKTREVVVAIVLPERFGLEVDQDLYWLSVDQYWTESFNITITNMGNGFENYTLVYNPQTTYLLVSAVNDTVEVPPGDSTNVEVFVSPLDDVQAFIKYEHKFTVRSVDMPSMLTSVWINVTVTPFGGMEVAVSEEDFTVLPGDVIEFQVTITNTGNYESDFALTIWGDVSLFQGGEMPSDHIFKDLGLGDSIHSNEHHWFPANLPPGNYSLYASVEGLSVHDLNVTVMIPIKVLVLREMDFRLVLESGGNISPTEEYYAVLGVTNQGNVPISYAVEYSGLPEWMELEMTDQEGTLGSLDTARVNLTFSVMDMDVVPPESVLVTFILVAPNGTQVSTVVVWMSTDFPEPWGSGSTWLLWMTMILVFVVVVATVLLFRGRR